MQRREERTAIARARGTTIDRRNRREVEESISSIACASIACIDLSNIKQQEKHTLSSTLLCNKLAALLERARRREGDARVWSMGCHVGREKMTVDSACVAKGHLRTNGMAKIIGIGTCAWHSRL